MLKMELSFLPTRAELYPQQEAVLLQVQIYQHIEAYQRAGNRCRRVGRNETQDEGGQAIIYCHPWPSVGKETSCCEIRNQLSSRHKVSISEPKQADS